MKTEHKVIAGSMIFALLVWVSEAVLDYFYFHERSFVELLISNMPPHETYIRLLVLACFLVFGILMSRVIAERKRAEEALREERDRAQKYLNTSGVIIVVIDADQTVTLVNRKGCEILGYEEKEIVGKNWFDSFVPEKDRDKVKAVFEKLVAGEIEPVKYFENPVLTQSGKERMIAWRNTVLRNREGQVIATLSSGDDITERKRIEEALRRYADEQAALYAVTSAVATSLDPGEMLSTVLEVVLSVLDSDAGWVTMPGPTLDDPPRVVAWRGVPESFVAAEMATPIRDCPVCAPLLASGDAQTEPQLIVGCPRLPPKVLASVNLYSHVCIPLSAGCQVLGILDVAWRAPRPCTKSDRALLLAIGREVGLALRNAQLYQTARQVDRLRVLNELDQILAATLDPETVAEVALHQIAAALDAPMGALFVLPPQANNPKRAFTLEQGWTDTATSEEEAQRLQAFLRQFQDNREAISFSGDDLTAIGGDLDLAQRWGPNSLVVPIWGDGRLIAVLVLGGQPADRPFTGEDQALAQAAAGRAGQAIVNAWLYQNERRRAAQLAVVNQVARRAASILDFDQLLHEVVTAIQQGFHYYHVGLFLLDKVAGELAIEATASGFEDVAPPEHRLVLGEGMVGWTAKTSQPLLANDVSREPRYVLGILKESLTKAELCVPLKLVGKVIGVLDIQSTQLNAFDETDLIAMETLADQLAVAIGNARLYQETVRQLKEVETLGTVTTHLARSLDLDQVLQSIVDSATHLIPASTSGVLHFVDEAAGKLIPQAISPEVSVQKSMEMPVGKGIAGLVIQEKRLINVPNVEQDPRFLLLATDTLKKSLLTAPLMIDGDCIGTLSLNSDQVNAFGADDERLLTTLAAQATIAVRNARLHQEIQHRVEELVFLNRVGRAVASSLDMEQVLTTVMQEATDVLKVEAVSVLLLDDEGKALVFETVVGSQAEKMKGLRLSLEQGIAGWVAREGHWLLVPDVREDPRFYSGIDEITGFVTKSVLAVPLKVKGKVIGVIEAMNKTGGDFGRADVALLSSIAQSAAIAIENVRLFEEVKQQHEQLRALTTRLAEAEEVERQQLARELHDQVGQNLTALGINLNIMRAQMSEETADLVRSRLDDSLVLVEQTTERIRNVMADLRPPVLDDYGLVTALHWYGTQFTSRTGIAVTVQGEEIAPRPPASIENALFRIAQEALTNVARHAQATQVTVTVKVDNGTVCLVVADDGIGFDPARLAGPDGRQGWGLITMTERAEAVGGCCRIESNPQQGTRIIAEVAR